MHSPRPGLPEWLTEEGPESDVVLLTSLSLSRNSVDFRFPHMMESGEKITLLSRSEDAVRELEGGYRSWELPSLKEDDRRLLVEQRYLISESGENRENTLSRILIRESGCASLLLNGEDHFMMRQIVPGFEVEQSYIRLEAMDEILERHFNYAVSMDMGYLRSRIDRVGNGLAVEVLLHLPALSRTPRFDEVLAHAQREDMKLGRFGDTESSSLGQVYLLSAYGDLGSRESELLEKLALVVIEFVHYEREAREALKESGGLEFIDMLWRDYAVLRYSRLLGLKESIDLYSRVRMGQGLGVLPACSAGISLFFLTQPGHLRYLSRTESVSSDMPEAYYGSGDSEDGNSDVFAPLRAQVFRDRLSPR